MDLDELQQYCNRLAAAQVAKMSAAQRHSLWCIFLGTPADSLCWAWSRGPQVYPNFVAEGI